MNISEMLRFRECQKNAKSTNRKPNVVIKWCAYKQGYFCDKAGLDRIFFGQAQFYTIPTYMEAGPRL